MQRALRLLRNLRLLPGLGLWHLLRCHPAEHAQAETGERALAGQALRLRLSCLRLRLSCLSLSPNLILNPSLRLRLRLSLALTKRNPNPKPIPNPNEPYP